MSEMAWNLVFLIIGAGLMLLGFVSGRDDR